MRLTRAIWALLALALGTVVAATWWATRPVAPEPAWIGSVRVLAGDGRDGWLDGPAGASRFSEPFGVAVAPDGAIYVSDAGSAHRIRRIEPSGVVTTVAGAGRGFADGPAAAARFATPSAIAMAPDGSLVVADTGNHAIRRIAVDGTVTTVAGNGTPGYVDGPAADARFRAPVGVAVTPSGRIIVADTYNDRIRAIDPDGVVRTLAGGDGDPSGALTPSSFQSAGSVDGPGPEARFDTPCGVAIDSRGRILVADTGNGLIRAIGLDGVVSTIGKASVGLERPMAIAVGPADDLFIVDEAGRVVVAASDGTQRLLAGGRTGFADGAEREAQFRRPSGVAIAPVALFEQDADARPAALVVADTGNAMVRLVSPAIGDAAPGLERESHARTRTRIGWPWTPVNLTPPSAPRVAPHFDAEAFARVPLLWPVSPVDGPHEIAGTFGEARGEAGQERFHAGLDVRKEQGTLVRAVREGIVSSPISTFAFDTLNEGVRIGPLAYIHIRVGRRTGVTRAKTVARSTNGSLSVLESARVDLRRFAPVLDGNGSLVRVRAMRGAHFSTGDEVGSVNAFNHVHLNVGWPGEEHDPLQFRLVQFRDSIPPTIESGGIRLFDEAWQPLNPDRIGPVRGRGRARRASRLPPLEPVLIRGRIHIVIDAWDQADGNMAHRRLGLKRVGYQVLDRSGTPVSGFEVPHESIRFDRMRRDSDAPRLVYATGSGIPVYGARRTQFLYVATTEYRNGIAKVGAWDTSSLTPGEYVVRGFVEDFAGNRASRDLKVVIAP